MELSDVYIKHYDSLTRIEDKAAFYKSLCESTEKPKHDDFHWFFFLAVAAVAIMLVFSIALILILLITAI